MSTNNIQVSDAFNRYYQSLSVLRDLEIIRGDKITGDIGEFIAHRVLGVELENSQQTAGFDGMLNGRSVQIKYSQATQSKNINVGNPDDYDDLILVLHSRSCHFPEDNDSDFVIYTIQSEDVSVHFTRADGGKYTCTRNMISAIDNRQERNLDYTDLN